MRVTWDVREEAILQLQKVSVQGKDSLAHPLSQVENDILLINVPINASILQIKKSRYGFFRRNDFFKDYVTWIVFG